MHILEHLQKLQDEFRRYFPEVDMTRDELSFIRNPFVTDVHGVPEAMQEFLDMCESGFSCLLHIKS